VKRGLQWQIFGALSVTGVLALVLATLAAFWPWREPGGIPPFAQQLGAFVVADLPEHDPARAQRELEERARRLSASISVWNERGQLVARAGRQLGERPDLSNKRGAFDYDEHTVWIALERGRVMGVSLDHHPRGPRFFPMALFALILATLLGSHLAARRITRRLKLLEQGVTRFGSGDLAARVTLQGRDEIAGLARAFNQSSARIAGLLTQQRRMLQSASHELRSPLARLRMALELLAEPAQSPAQREELRADAAREIEELDALIGDLLLAGRLTDSELPRSFGEVALAPLVREEAARVGASAETVELTTTGDARMLRSMLRNLLENARRYGAEPITTRLSRDPQGVLLCVEDAGSGIPESEREKIFEPFYRPPAHREARDGGVGLGLALVRSIAEHHGGSVSYQALPRGSRFEVRLPV
jgi:signal transduction histidine kinase